LRAVFTALCLINRGGFNRLYRRGVLSVIILRQSPKGRQSIKVNRGRVNNVDKAVCSQLNCADIKGLRQAEPVCALTCLWQELEGLNRLVLFSPSGDAEAA